MTKMTEWIGYVGTYTKGESLGIYSFTLDTEKLSISAVDVAATIDNPTYLAISQDNRFLYSIVKDGERGGVESFSVNKASGKLTPLNKQVSVGSPPCHVSIDSQTQRLFSANYHKGTVESHLLHPHDGTISPPMSVIQHEGRGPDPRQEKPHTHFAQLTPDEKFLAVVELGIDQLLTYKVGGDGKLTLVKRLTTAPGSGPRHLAFHPNRKFAYLLTEFSSEVIVLTYNESEGSFTAIQTITTLPDDFRANNQGSAIHISSDGKFVYAGNRGHNSIAVFGVNAQTGQLGLVDRVSTVGDWPRDFVLDPTEKFVIAANQNSSNLVLFSRNAETGKLTALQSDIMIPDPVCVKFLHH